MNERLDRIEEILANLAQQQQITAVTLNQVSDRLDQVSEQQQQNNIAIAKLTKRMDEVNSRFDNLVYETQRVISNSFESLERLEASVEFMTDAVTRLTRNADHDRQAIREIWTSIRNVQAENRQIWQYLLRESGNGHASTDQ